MQRCEAELRPFLERVEMHARVTGYLDSIKVDAGDFVRENQVIATLECTGVEDATLSIPRPTIRRREADVGSRPGGTV